jgi:hypothetical protein
MYLLEEFGIQDKPTMYSDSQSMIASIKSNAYRGTAATHIATKFHLAADLVRSGDVELVYIPSNDMVADTMTKALPKPAFVKFCVAMGLTG